MKICILTTSYPRTADDDSGIFVKRLVEAYAQIGLSGTVVVPLDSTELINEQNRSFKICRFGYGIFSKGNLAFGAGIVPNIKRNPMLILQAPGLILSMAFKMIRLKEKFDCVHANWIPTAFAALIFRVFTGTRYIITLRGADFKLLRHRLLRPIFYLPLRCAARIVSVNETFISALTQMYGLKKDRFELIPNGISLREVSSEEYDQFMVRNGLSTETNYLLYVGSLIPRKQVELLIELLAKLTQANFKLILCGGTEDTGYLNMLRQKVRELDLVNRIIFTGRVAPDQIPLYLKLAWAFILPSQSEGRPNSALEAMRSGTPVFLSDIPEHREFIQSDHNGYLFDPADIQSLADKIMRLSAQPDEISRIAHAGQSSVANYSWIEAAKRYQSTIAQASESS